jgi:hypothetical protein
VLRDSRLHGNDGNIEVLHEYRAAFRVGSRTWPLIPDAHVPKAKGSRAKGQGAVNDLKNGFIQANRKRYSILSVVFSILDPSLSPFTFALSPSSLDSPVIILEPEDVVLPKILP